ncbi:MAG: DUF86 domain-containing protein [Elusimicrobiota bacterium]
MKKEPEIFVKHILDSIVEIERHTLKISLPDFLKSTLIQDATIRRLEIIGEAVKKIPAEARSSAKDIPWKQIAGLRDLLIHEYFGVDLRLVWKVVIKDLPDLKKNMLKLLKELDSN